MSAGAQVGGKPYGVRVYGVWILEVHAAIWRRVQLSANVEEACAFLLW